MDGQVGCDPSEGVLCDVMDGAVYQQLLSEGKLYRDSLSIIWNFDGVPVFHSSFIQVLNMALANATHWAAPETLKRKYNDDNTLVRTNEAKNGTFLVPYIAECTKLAQDGIVEKSQH